MSNKSRYVFDTNVIVSALLFEQGNPGQAFYKALDEADILLSEEVVREIKDVLSREKFDRYITWEEREQFLQLLIRETTLVEITDEIRECRAPKDNKFLELAVSGAVSHLITGGPDLLALDPFRGIRILTPKQFLDSLIGRS
ncbi:MAG: putative toxin-antitoxin system toxin component, PIN family [Thermodesulfobacteriota bacterium]